MGMYHDFDEVHGGPNGPCGNCPGLMNYGNPKDDRFRSHVWSACSRADFLEHYNTIIANGDVWSWCLTGN